MPTPIPIPPIRVGVTDDSPPFCFRQGGRLVGIELDLASQLGREFGRPLRVYPMTFDELTQAVLNHEIDIIMSGMTITRLRELRISFSDPYLESGLAVLVRRTDAARFKTPASVLKGSLRIGVTKGTTGEKFVRGNVSDAQVFSYQTNGNAIADLEQRRIDAFVTDVPIVAWYASTEEGELLPLLSPLLTKDTIGWGFRPSSETMREKADAALERWKHDGTLSYILHRWLPNWEPNSEPGGKHHPLAAGGSTSARGGVRGDTRAPARPNAPGGSTERAAPSAPPE